MAATEGDVFVRLIVTFLRRTPRCIKAAKVGALLTIKDIGPDGRSSIGLPHLLTDGGVSSTSKRQRSKLPIENENKRRLKHRLETYSVLGDFILGVDQTTVREGRFAKQVFFPLFPPLFVCLSDEEGRDPIR